MSKEIYQVAIDGPAGAGKTTIAKRLAAELDIDRIDTGAMYRAVALKLQRTGTDYTDAVALEKILETTKLDFSGGHIFLDGEDVEGYIRTPEISDLASASSTVLAIREKLVALQRELAKTKSVIMDGRDITTNVLKDAKYKFYLTASVEERAKRRALELEEKGLPCDIKEVEEEIAARDYRDMHREHNPLTQAPDAVYLDTSNLNIDQVVEKMKSYIK